MVITSQIKNQHLLWRAGFGPSVNDLNSLPSFHPVKTYADMTANSERPPGYIDIAKNFAEGFTMGLGEVLRNKINTKVYYVSLGSFDTHVNQANQQQRLFTEMNEAVNAFVSDLKKNNRFEDVLLFSFSEFGRRVAQNASGGTDHGTANNMFLVSGGLKQQGLLNSMPDLTNLNEGDLNYEVDFKQVYATILNKWLGVDDKAILGEIYRHLSFI